MKKCPKIVQCDKRGQIVIPKDIRQDLGIDESTGFWVFSIGDEGILLKKVDAPALEEEEEIVEELEQKADKISLSRRSLSEAKKTYKKTRQGNLELL